MSEYSQQQYIKPLLINGLHGRVLTLPAPKAHPKEILFVYGQHSLIERWQGLSAVLNRYGRVTMPDMPGFGGMDSLYKVGQQPTIDNLADCMAVFVREHYGNKRFRIVGMSLGFAVVTRMMQRHPDIAEQVDMMVSIVGLVHHDDFIFSKQRFAAYKAASWFFALRGPAWFFKNVFLQPAWLRRVYQYSSNAKQKFEGKMGVEFAATMDMEINLWQKNDLRTQMFTNSEMFRLDNCQSRLDLPVWYVDVAADRYFNSKRVKQHLAEIFTEVHVTRSSVDSHAPSVIADAETAAPYLPEELRQALSS